MGTHDRNLCFGWSRFSPAGSNGSRQDASSERDATNTRTQPVTGSRGRPVQGLTVARPERNNRVVPIAVGALAPLFRLLSAQGPEVGLEDYRTRSHVLVWFTKGIACPFCRRQMVQVAKLYPRLCELGTEILLIAPTRLEQARLYMRRFAVPYPYLCDPDYQVRRAWGLEVRQSAGAYLRMFLAARTLQRVDVPQSDDIEMRPRLQEVPTLLTDEDAGLFLVDREGVIRWGETGAYVGASGSGPVIRPLPSDGVILRAVADL